MEHLRLKHWILFLYVHVLYVCVATDQVGPQFRKNAAEFMEVGFNKGRVGTRVTELAVTVRVKEMFEDGVEVDVDDLSLEIKADEGCWTKAAESPVRRGKEKQMWRVKVIPCKEHSVRIGVKRDGCVEYFQYPETIGPASSMEIANSHFRPSKPENIVITPAENDSVSVSWRESECAESYDLWYESDSALDLGNMTVQAGVGSVTVAGLENCTEYTINIVAMVGAEFSEGAEAEFSTCNQNETDISDTMVTKKCSDCKHADTQCEFSTKKLEDFSEEEMFIIQEDDIEVASCANETQFEAQTGNSSISYTLSSNYLLTTLSLWIISWK